jgi:hypothetical protein
MREARAASGHARRRAAEKGDELAPSDVGHGDFLRLETPAAAGLRHARIVVEEAKIAKTVRENMARLRELRLAKEAQEVRTEIAKENESANTKSNKRRFRSSLLRVMTMIGWKGVRCPDVDHPLHRCPVITLEPQCQWMFVATTAKTIRPGIGATAQGTHQTIAVARQGRAHWRRKCTARIACDPPGQATD